MRYWLVGNITLLLFGFVVFLVLCCVVYVVYIVCKALFKALFFCKEDHIQPKGQGEDDVSRQEQN